MQKNDMEIMLRLRCTGCGKCFIVEDDQVETDYLSCPHCQDEIEVHEPDDEVNVKAHGRERFPNAGR